MNITVSDPTPAPEMPVLYAMAAYQELSTGFMWTIEGQKDRSIVEGWISKTPGSRLIKIDPNAPSFEPGPTEWVDSKTDSWKIWVSERGHCVVQNVSDKDCQVIGVPNTRTDIGHLISALVTKWHEAKEGT